LTCRRPVSCCFSLAAGCRVSRTTTFRLSYKEATSSCSEEDSEAEVFDSNDEEEDTSGSTSTSQSDNKLPLKKSALGKRRQRPRKKSKIELKDKKRSWVWNWFSKPPPGDEQALCGLCKKYFPYLNSSPSKLGQHLRSVHAKEIAATDNQIFLENEEIEEAVAHLIMENHLHLSILNSPFFWQLVVSSPKSAEFKPISKERMKQLLGQKREGFFERLKTLFKEDHRSMILIADGWTSKGAISYIGAAVTYLRISNELSSL